MNFFYSVYLNTNHFNNPLQDPKSWKYTNVRYSSMPFWLQEKRMLRNMCIRVVRSILGYDQQISAQLNWKIQHIKQQPSSFYFWKAKNNITIALTQLSAYPKAIIYLENTWYITKVYVHHLTKMVIKETTTSTTTSSTSTSRRDSNANPNKEKAKGKKDSPTTSAGSSPTKSKSRMASPEKKEKTQCICEICTCG